MVRKIKSLFAIVLLTLVGLSFSGCGDTIEEYYEDGAKIKTDWYHVYSDTDTDPKRDHWYWDQDMQRWQCIIQVREITEYIYNDGAIYAGVFVDEGGYESLNSLPFIRTYKDEATQKYFEETIGYDVALGTSGYYTICFYIQTSNGIQYVQSPQYYEFKVNLMWY